MPMRSRRCQGGHGRGRSCLRRSRRASASRSGPAPSPASAPASPWRAGSRWRSTPGHRHRHALGHRRQCRNAVRCLWWSPPMRGATKSISPCVGSRRQRRRCLPRRRGRASPAGRHELHLGTGAEALIAAAPPDRLVRLQSGDLPDAPEFRRAAAPRSRCRTRRRNRSICALRTPSRKPARCRRVAIDHPPGLGRKRPRSCGPPCRMLRQCLEQRRNLPG